MDPEYAEALIDDIHRTINYTLYGGNDPEDHGDVRQALAEMGRHLIKVIRELKNIQS